MNFLLQVRLDRCVKKLGVFLSRLLCPLIVTALAAEATCWIGNYPSNYRAPQYLPGNSAVTPGFGWRHIPGSHHYSDPDEDPPRNFTATYLDDFSRITSSKPDFTRTPLALVGCSFVEGFGLDDAETSGWKLQSILPAYSVENFGTSGYGTLQSLFVIRDLPKRYRQTSGSIIVYGFADFHQSRNIRNPGGQRSWTNDGIFPVCDEAGCSVWSGKRMGRWFQRSRCLSLLENLWDFLLYQRRADTARTVTERLLSEMKSTVQGMGARFIVAPVTPLSPDWLSFFRSAGIEVATCVPTITNRKQYLLGDGHPKGIWNEEYSRCLARYIVEHP